MMFWVSLRAGLTSILVAVATSTYGCAVWAQSPARDKATQAKPAPPLVAPSRPPVFAPPPRTIADITAFLDQEKPDPAKTSRMEAEAEAQPPTIADRVALKDFYFRRAQARAALGRFAGAIADAKEAIANSDDYLNEGSRIEAFLENLLRNSGDYAAAIAAAQRIAQRLDVTNKNKGRNFAINAMMVRNLVHLAQVDRAEGYLRASQALLAQARAWPNGQPYLSDWGGRVEEARARILSARGRFAEAAAAFQRAGALYRDAKAKCPFWTNRARCDYDSLIFFMDVYEATDKAQEGRLSEAEVDVRQALLSRLKGIGKYHSDIANGLSVLSRVFIAQARYSEAEVVARASVEIFKTLGYGEDARPYVLAQDKLLAAVYNLGRYSEVKELGLSMDRGTQSWAPERSAFVRFNASRIFAYYYTNEVEKGIAASREELSWSKIRFGEKNINTAISRAMLATGLTIAGRDDEALREFAASIPSVLAGASNEDDEDPTLISHAYRRLQNFVESNIVLLARSSLPNRAEESLRLADAIRTRSVQNALAAAAARTAARTPALAELARKEQDLQKQVQAQATLISNLLAEPPEQRQGAILKDLQQELERLRGQRRAARGDIARRFPEYSNLVRPAPATADDIRSALRSDEALISFYFGSRNGFVWAVTKTGPVAMATLPITAAQLEHRVQALRRALDSDASTIDAMPAFDVSVAHELYRLLLAPVEATWRPAKSLIVVTNGALGQLPISLLPTEHVPMADQGTDFTWYRRVPWLARTHAVVALPSASALRTLRTMPTPMRSRQSFIGFGDPIFSAEHDTGQTGAESVDTPTNSSRGARIAIRATLRADPNLSVSLGLLPRLPETAEELKAIALSLQVDPVKSLHLGRAANEQTVSSLDLARYRIVAFATHGLVPGDLDGLTQPALALTAPNVAGVGGDGLLTAEEILQLKLDADWVVLSACNTGTGQGAGAEAVSGLGRAFFYAGSRALLVTNWPVHSESARDIVTGVFQTQASNPGLSRAEALRQTMMAILDGGEAKDHAGKTLYSYGHPLFWAPYSIVGDGGAL